MVLGKKSTDNYSKIFIYFVWGYKQNVNVMQTPLSSTEAKLTKEDVNLYTWFIRVYLTMCPLIRN